MKTIKVGLVQINNSFSNSCYFPYSIGLLQAYFQKHGRNADCVEFLEPIFFRTPPEQAAAQFREADIVGFSVYVWNYKLSLEIAKRIKKNKPETLIVFGGPHVPNNAEVFLREHPFVDIACHGEGEIIFTMILENSPARTWEDIPSISFLDKGVFIHNPKTERIKNLSDIPSPYLNGVFDCLMRKQYAFEWVGLWETNRGCPFSCSYCDWGSATQSKMYTFDMERLDKEIEWFAKNKIEYIFCCDSNFGILKRDIDITTHVAEMKKREGYPKALSVQNTKNATERSYTVQKILAEGELNKGVTLALQTVNKTALKNVGRENISLESFKELQCRYNRDRIETYTDLILGLPGETYDSFADGTSQIIEDGQHNRIQFINLSILPNAQMGDHEYQKKHGLVIIETKTINHHGSLSISEDGIDETQQLVVGTDTMPMQDWLKTRIFSWMCSFLYFDKIMQIPILLLHKVCGCNFRELTEAFLIGSDERYPILSEINQFFTEEAENIQQGGPEYCPSEEWLNVYWPHDEYVFIKLCADNRIGYFYQESRDILIKFMKKKNIEIPSFFNELIDINHFLIKQPLKKEDIVLCMHYNIWDAYQSALTSKDFTIQQGKFVYQIDDRIDENWNSWEEWLREIVWYGNKKGAYLYRIKSV